MKKMRIAIVGASGQRTTFDLTIGSGMVVEITRLPVPIGKQNPVEWEKFVDIIAEQMYLMYRSDVRDLLDWRDTFVASNCGRCELQAIHIYDV